MTKLLPHMSNKLTIKSIGWCLNDSIGGYPGKKFPISIETKPEKSDIFSKPFKNFGRLDSMSKAVCTSVAFALKGAKLYPQEEKQSISIYFSNKEGSLKSDTAYFKDFVNYGETAGRANLFLYTLPSSPLGEASVHFGLTGDLAYFADSKNQLKAMLAAAEDACEFRKSANSSSKEFLIGLGNSTDEKTEAIFLFLSNSDSEGIVKTEDIFTSLTDFESLKIILSPIILSKNEKR